MTSQAQTLIKEHYTDLRRRYHNTDDQDKTMPITPRQLESIIRLAEAHAKMYLSETVDVPHAQGAIDLMDLFLNVTLRGEGTEFIEFGMTAEQRKKDRDPTTLLVGIINESIDGMDEQEVYDRMESEGYTRQDVEKYLEKLGNEGRLLKDGYDKWRTSRI